MTIPMAKTIAIANDVYEMLSREKMRDESFSEVIRRLARSKGSLMDFYGAWGDLSEEEFREIEEAIKSADQPLSEVLKRRKI